MSKRVLFFLDSLISGGKERRAVELFHYLKKNTKIEFQVVLTEKEIHYKQILSLEIPIIILERVSFLKKDPFIFIRFLRIVKSFKPNIIHSWGAMTTFYSLPSKIIFRIPLINGQIADAVPIESRSFFSRSIWFLNKHFSDVIISNSFAGLRAYNVNADDGLVINNGVRLSRFKNLKCKKIIREEFNIKTKFVIVMVASFNKFKDYDLFFKIAKTVCGCRKDVTFISIGDGDKKTEIIEKVKYENLDCFKFAGRISNVEELVNSCDIGVLFSNILTGEGISNAIIEYMALMKPVIATNAGGTNELVDDGVSGFLVDNDMDSIIEKINILLDKSQLREGMGDSGRKIVENKFNIEKMGEQFVNQYCLIT